MLGTWLSYQASEPLLFTNFQFWVFLVICLAGFTLFYRYKRLRNAWLFLASLFFYYKSAGIFVVLLLLTIVINFAIGWFLGHSKKHRRLILGFGVALNLSILSYYKYATLFTEWFNAVFATHWQVVDYPALWSNMLLGSDWTISAIILPVGISFYIFQSISYIVDVYRHKLPYVRQILDFGFYIAFFPQLVAGPIVRAAEFGPQLNRNYQLSTREFSWALSMIIAGLIKKVVISDYISLNFVDRVFENPILYTGFENLMAVYGYALQIYCDFSGYTDIAIGVALLFGFHLPLNFNSPYKAENISDFWRRWHISLSTWLRDYLYIPLGGSRRGPWVMWIALMLTMLLGGLWHGAHEKFILWGGLHGLALVVHKLWRYWRKPLKRKPSTWRRVLSIVACFHYVCFAWIFFRASDMQQVGLILSQIVHAFSWATVPQVFWAYPMTMLLLVVGYVLHWYPNDIKDQIRSRFMAWPMWLKGLVAVGVALLIYQAQSSELQPFIYFQF